MAIASVKLFVLGVLVFGGPDVQPMLVNCATSIGSSRLAQTRESTTMDKRVRTVLVAQFDPFNDTTNASTHIIIHLRQQKIHPSIFMSRAAGVYVREDDAPRAREVIRKLVQELEISVFVFD